MTEKKRYYRTNVNLEDNNHKSYYNIRDRKKEGNNVLFMVNGKYTSKEIVDRLNEQDVRIKELESENKMLKTTKRWSFNGGVIVGTDICEEGIPHTNRSIVTHLNMYERKIRELEEENEQLKKRK